jgi:hypothetical protein
LNPPSDVSRYEVRSSQGFWQFGIDRVEFKQNEITIRTFIIQDHGGLRNTCISDGEAVFEIAFAGRDA